MRWLIMPSWMRRIGCWFHGHDDMPETIRTQNLIVRRLRCQACDRTTHGWATEKKVVAA